MNTTIYFILHINICKCTIVYPPGAGNKIQFIVGIGIPASNLPTIQSVTWGYVIKTNYPLPTNLSMYSDPPPNEVVNRHSRSVTRWKLYSAIEEAINRSGLPGKECLMRTICEASHITFDPRNVIGEILHAILQPSTTDNTGTEYHYAEKMGRLNLKECSTLYVKCPLSILDLFTIVTDYYNVRQNPPIFAM